MNKQGEIIFRIRREIRETLRVVEACSCSTSAFLASTARVQRELSHDLPQLIERVSLKEASADVDLVALENLHASLFKFSSTVSEITEGIEIITQALNRPIL